MNRVRKTPWTAFRKSRRGNMTVELALLAPVMAFMLVGAIDFGSFIFGQMKLQNASRAGAQYAIQAAGNVDDTASITAAAQAATDLEAGTTVLPVAFCGCADGSESAYDSSTGCDGSCAGGEFPALSIRVTVANTFTPLFAYPGLPDSLALTGVTVMQVP